MKNKLLIPALLIAGICNMALADSVYTAGLGVGIAPRYAGSKQSHALFAPFISAQWDNGFSFDPIQGLAYQKEFGNGLFIGGMLSYDYGRSDRDRAELPGSDHLAGMGRISSSVIGSAQVGTHLWGKSTLSFTLDNPFTHSNNGVAGHLDVVVPLLETEHDQLNLTTSAHGGTGRYMQTWYGVTATQSAASGFKTWSPKSGVDNINVNLKWAHEFNKSWVLTSEITASRLVGDASNSPIVQSKNGLTAIESIGYQF